MTTYIYQHSGWPLLSCDPLTVAGPLTELRYLQGRLIGRMESLGFQQRNSAVLRTLTEDVVKTSEIEGETLAPDQVRSSIARRLGIEEAAIHPEDRKIEGIVRMTLEATRNHAAPITKERLWGWHELLFPDPPPWMKLGAWRDDSRGPMRVVSREKPSGESTFIPWVEPEGNNPRNKVSRTTRQERVHYEAPPADQLIQEMASFLRGVNEAGHEDPILRAAKAHLWFVTIHPFDDGNGRIARAIADWALARSEGSERRYYSMSAQIRRERDDYYEVLERTQKGTLDITGWLLWFIGCLSRAIAGSETALEKVFKKDQLWKRISDLVSNERQRRVLNMLQDGSLAGKLTSTRWAKIAKCSQDTATRDIQDLVSKGLLVKDPAGGRSTSYSLPPDLLANP